MGSYQSQPDNKPTTEVIKNMEVSYEIVSPEFKEQLIATTAEIRDIFVHEPEFVIVEAPKAETTFHLFDVTEEVKEIKVKEVVEFVNITEVDNGVIKHSLEESNSGTAIMGSAKASGETRAKDLEHCAAMHTLP